MSDELEAALHAASERVQQMRTELHDEFPAFRGTLAVAGVLVGHGLASFVSNGMTDEQIIVQMVAILAEIRQTRTSVH